MKTAKTESKGAKSFLVFCLVVTMTLSTLSAALLTVHSSNAKLSEGRQNVLKQKMTEAYIRNTAHTFAYDIVRDVAENELSDAQELQAAFADFPFGNLRMQVKAENGTMLFSNLEAQEEQIDSMQFDVNISRIFSVEQMKQMLEKGWITQAEFEKKLDFAAPSTQCRFTLPVQVTVSLAQSMTVQDIPYFIQKAFDYAEKRTTEIDFVLRLLFFINTALSVLFWILVLKAAGRRTGETETTLSKKQRFPGDVLLLLSAGSILGIGTLVTFGTRMFTCYVQGSLLALLLRLFGTAVVVGVLLLSLIFTLTVYYLTVQAKAHSFWKCTVPVRLWRRCKGLGKRLKAFLQDLPSLWQCIAVIAVYFVLEAFLLAVDGAVLALLCTLIFLVFLLLVYRRFRRLAAQTEEIADGSLQKKVETEKLYGDLKHHAEAVNRIGDTIETAVEERMKSESFRTELITNVTHDIKTPLTSIISYVDLLQKEDLQNPAAEEYVGVLARQSARLKKLIEDLLEASKASSGTLSVQLETVDVNILLSQVFGEFEERLAKQDLDLRMQTETLLVCADRRHLWRVLDNLLSNVQKYAQPHTRVYLDLTARNGRAELVLRNISKEPLHIEPQALTERFVRGEASRNTEGSGLGLSIAKSLTELQNGTFEIDIDGDLFKVKITLPLA